MKALFIRFKLLTDDKKIMVYKIKYYVMYILSFSEMFRISLMYKNVLASCTLRKEDKRRKEKGITKIRNFSFDVHGFYQVLLFATSFPIQIFSL